MRTFILGIVLSMLCPAFATAQDSLNVTRIGFYDSPGAAKDIKVVGDLAYLADWDSGIRIYNIANLAAPIEIGSVNTPGTAYSVQVVGDYAYVADRGSGLRVIDVSNPAAPTEVGYYDTPGFSEGLDVVGNLAYVGDVTAGLRIIDVSNPMTPFEVGYYLTPDYACGVKIVGNLAYVAGYGQGLRIIDVSIPSAPVEIGFFDTPDISYSVAISGSFACVADRYSGLRIIDISNPPAPTEVGYVDTPGWAIRVTVAGNYAFLCDRNRGLRIIDISAPSSPVEVGYYDTIGDADGVFAVGNIAYVGDATAGFDIFDCSAAVGANGVILEIQDTFVGCVDSCTRDTLYMMFDQVNYVTGQVFLQLPPELDADWVSGFGYQNVMPGLNLAPNLIFAAARRTVSGNQIEVNITWQPPYSDGDDTKYIAAIPLQNASGDHGDLLSVAGVCSTFWDSDQFEHINELGVEGTELYVDCEEPVGSLEFVSAPSCAAFGSAIQIEGSMHVTLTRGPTPPNSQLILAYVEVNGNPAQQVILFDTPQGDFNNSSFPDALEATAIFGWLTEGCNELVLHGFDAECNEVTTAALTISKDTTPPGIVVTNTSAFCYNNVSSSPQYGGDWLDDYLNVSTDLTPTSETSGCYAAEGTLYVSYGAHTFSAASLDATNFPATNAEALALWNWIVTQVPGANGETYTFGVVAEDCAGNSSPLSTFDICIDLTTPGNSVTRLDARPAHLGVWLAWEWTAGTQAQEMRIYRSPWSGEYPAYASDLWSSLANYDVAAVPPVGWTLVANQSGLTGTITSAGYGTVNNRGDFHQHVDGSQTYWLDAELGWVDGDGNASNYRDTYRYVSFVKDVGGNWSIGVPVVIGQNADRSTNYWLGDFSTADSTGNPLSRGRVDTDDLALLSVKYFTSAPGDFRNIGPVLFENGIIGKGIPDPDLSGTINFLDLVPFSFNYNAVSPVAGAREFNCETEPIAQRSNQSLDEHAMLQLRIPENDLRLKELEFTVEILLTGNEENEVKAVEIVLDFDTEVLELINAEPSPLSTDENGRVFSKVESFHGMSGRIGIVAAACGPASTLHGNDRLASLTFRVLNADTPDATVRLSEGQLLDGYGSIHATPENVVTLWSQPFLLSEFALYQNYPNPFNPRTTIRFELKESCKVKLEVFNTLGQVVTTLIEEEMSAGVHAVVFDATGLSSGLYIYSIEANAYTARKKLLLLK